MWFPRCVREKAVLLNGAAAFVVWFISPGWLNAQALIPRPDHVVIVVEENRNYFRIIGSDATPYINSLAQSGALMTEYFALTHPSEPNYLGLFSGSTQGVSDDSCPHTFRSPNLGSELLDAGLTFTGYAEGMPGAGATTCDSGSYARRHVPWINFVNVPRSNSVPFSQFPSDYSQLPDVAFVVPNLDNDMHDGSNQQADNWLRQHMDPYIQWAQTHNSLFILTWDESGSNPNQVVTVFVGPMVQPGQYCGRVNHYNLLRTLEDMFGLPHAGASAGVPPIAQIWTAGNPPPAVSLTSPAPGATFAAPATVILGAEASSESGIARVQFFQGASLVGEAAAAPFAFTWSNASPGTYCLRAQAIDNAGGMKSSDEATITVTGSTGSPFAGVAGNYSGLFFGLGQVTVSNSGYFTFSLSARGAFTGRLALNGAQLPLKGKFDAGGSAIMTARQRDASLLTIQLAIDLSNPAGVVHGSVSNVAWTAILDGGRNTGTNGATAGRYTFLVQGNADAATAPGGNGAGMATLTASGNVRASGTLGDGTRFVDSTFVMADGRWPFYAALYHGAGAILGWVTMNGSPASSFQGDLFWFKPASPRDRIYPQGFSLATTIDGALFRAPPAGASPMGWTNGVAVLAGGNLPEAIVLPAFLRPGSQLVLSNDNVLLSLSLSRSTGDAHGTFTHPLTHMSTRIQAVVQQGLDIIGGLFVGTNQSGSIRVGPAPP